MKSNTEVIIIALLLVIAGNTAGSALISCIYHGAATFVFLTTIFTKR